MKTVQIKITRNFRTHNEDVYLKETRERIVDLDEGDDADECESIVLKQITENFKKDYPHLQGYINFDTPRQLQPIDEQQSGVKVVSLKEKKTSYPIAIIEIIKAEIKKFSLSASIFEKVYKYQVEDNPELKKLYDEKLKELESKKNIQ